MSGSELVRCKNCGFRNRLPEFVGTKSIRCGNCQESLPTPNILARLEAVRDELAGVADGYTRFEWLTKREEIERRLAKQEAILANLPQLRGYVSTRRASFDLVVEIDYEAKRLEKRFATTDVTRILLVLGRILHQVLRIKLQGPLALPVGRT